MRNRFVFAAIVVAGLAVPSAVYAAPVDVPTPVHAMPIKGKTVKLALRNDSGSPVELKVGDQVMSLDAGKSVALKLPAGTRILMNTPTPTHAAGELITEVSTALNNATLAFK
ncbi:MAG TPA: hypothetical protein VF865_17750 [Acidobacteriaceae bacterium]